MNKEYPNKLLDDAKKYVNKMLLPLGEYYYHSYEHALDVMSKSMELAEEEWLDDKDAEMLWLAWLFHDTGFVIQYDNNEPIGAKIAQNYLKSMLYPPERIDKIEQLILATSPEYKDPKDIYEEIIKDADLDNLSREDFFKKNNDIKKELEIVKKIKIKDPEWIHASAELLREHKFRTWAEAEEKNKRVKDNLKKIEKLDKE